MNRLTTVGYIWGCVAFLFVLGCGAIDSTESNEMESAGVDDRAASTGHMSNNLLPDGTLAISQYLQSSDGSYRLNFQSDGNLVLKRMSDRTPLWSSGTSGKSATRFRFQSDGNLVIRSAAGTALWSTKTAGSGATKLLLHSAGQLLLYRNSTVVWSANGQPPTTDQCPNDPNKTEPGKCGCGVPEGSCGPECSESAGCYTVVPSGTSDDSSRIQSALNKLRSGNKLVLEGNFVIQRTIYLPSNFVWLLKGKISLGKNANVDSVGINENGIDSRRRTAITEQPGGATNIDMSGGVYYGNKQNNAINRVRLINFIRVTNSRFHDMTIESASDDNFTLGARSNHNECRRLVSRDAGLQEGDKSGNGLTDKGEYNKWFDSIAENCTSDGWTPKSRYSEFTRCVGRGNKGPGFGLYARRDGSPVDNPQGESIVGNKFYDCEAYNNKRAGFSANISSNCGNGAVIRDNFVQGAFYNNRMEGVLFRNKLASGVVSNNKVDILVFGNQGLQTSGSPASTGAGLGVDGTPVSAITGAVVGYHNSYEHSKNDIHLGSATNCSITVYNPQGRSPAVVKQGSGTNSVRTNAFSCPSSTSVWSVGAYCGGRYN